MPDEKWFTPDDEMWKYQKIIIESGFYENRSTHNWRIIHEQDAGVQALHEDVPAVKQAAGVPVIHEDVQAGVSAHSIWTVIPDERMFLSFPRRHPLNFYIACADDLGGVRYFLKPVISYDDLGTCYIPAKSTQIDALQGLWEVNREAWRTGEYTLFHISCTDPGGALSRQRRIKYAPPQNHQNTECWKLFFSVPKHDLEEAEKVDLEPCLKSPEYNPDKQSWRETVVDDWVFTIVHRGSRSVTLGGLQGVNFGGSCVGADPGSARQRWRTR